MSDAKETFVNPSGAKSGAAEFTSTAESMYSTWSQAASTIRALNGDQPWGHDDPGKEFNKNYLAGEGFANQALDGGDAVMKKLREIGPGVTSAVDGTVEVDDVIAKWFKQDG